MKSNKLTLYKNHVNGIGSWSIWFVDTTIYIEFSQTLGGSPQRVTEEVPEGKGGRTQREQIISRIRSRVNKQLDKGYVKTLEDAKAPPTNTLDMPLPMLATPLKRAGKVDTNRAFVQYKYNGHRCLIAKRNGKLIAYSRQGHDITSISHITNELYHLPEDMILDGELYCHGVKLQTIGSWIKRAQPETAKLTYVVYDCMEDMSYKDRLDLIKDVLKQTSSCVQVADTWSAANVCIPDELSRALDLGYEGLILRIDGPGYKSNRVKHLIKVKKFEDAEFEVVDIAPSKDGWGILQCKTPEGKIFGVSAPGTIPEKTEILRNKDMYIGKMVTVEFAEYTADNIPFHPVALQFREDI